MIGAFFLINLLTSVIKVKFTEQQELNTLSALSQIVEVDQEDEELKHYDLTELR